MTQKVAIVTGSHIASMGGKIAVPFHSAYYGTKFALEGLSESIQYELEPFGFLIVFHYG